MKKCLLMVPMLLIAVQTFGYDVEDEWDYVTFIDRQWDEKTQTLIEEEKTVFCPVRDVSCSRGILTGKPKAEYYAFKGKLPEGVVSGPGLEVRGEVHII